MSSSLLLLPDSRSLDVAPETSHLNRAINHPGETSLKIGAIWTVLGNATYAASQWMLITVMAHLGSREQLGHYALALGVCSPVFLLFNMQLRALQVTDQTQQYSLCDYLGVRLATNAVAMICVVSLAFWYATDFTSVLLMFLLSCFKLLESTADIAQGAMQQAEHMERAAQSLMAKGVFVFVLFAIPFYLSGNLLLGLAGAVAAQALSLMFFDRPALQKLGFKELMPKVTKGVFKAIGIKALPLGLTMMLISTYSNLPRYLIVKYIDTAGVGVFAAINYIPMLGSMLITAVGTTACPRLSQYAISSRPKFLRLIGKLIACAALFGIAGVIVSCVGGRSLLALLYGRQYASHADVLVWSMVAAALTYVSTVMGFAATALGRLKAQPWIVLASLGVLFASASVLVPARGLVGAAMSTVVASVVWLTAFSFLTLSRVSNVR